MSTRILVAVSLLAAASIAFAGSSGSPAGIHSQAGSNAVTATGSKLLGSYDSFGNGNSAALTAGGFTEVADLTVVCKKACSIGMAGMGQVVTAGGDWAICFAVDGTYYGCQYQGVQSGPSGFVSDNALGYAPSLAAGSHDVQLQLYAANSGAAYAYYQLDAHAYAP